MWRCSCKSTDIPSSKIIPICCGEFWECHEQCFLSFRRRFCQLPFETEKGWPIHKLRELLIHGFRLLHKGVFVKVLLHGVVTETSARGLIKKQSFTAAMPTVFNVTSRSTAQIAAYSSTQPGVSCKRLVTIEAAGTGTFYRYFCYRTPFLMCDQTVSNRLHASRIFGSIRVNNSDLKDIG